jgi:MFS family permease
VSLKNKTEKRHDPYAVLRIKEFNFFLITRFFLTMGIQLQSVVVGWQIYELTHDVVSLGMIGLAEAIPFIIVSFFSGHVADTFNRKWIVLIFSSFLLLVTLFLLYVSLSPQDLLHIYGTTPIYAAVVLIGLIRGFIGAALPSFMSQIVPRSLYTNAATWNSTVWHIGSILGPASAGLLIAVGYSAAYAVDLILIAIAIIAFAFIQNHPIPKKEVKEGITKSISEGLKFVLKHPIILGALSLDLFAVLFGGAIALLPAFADEVLHSGAIELGFLRAAPAIGAVIMALIIAYRPPEKNAGRNLFIAVAAFGLSTIFFGLSTNFYLAWFFLFLTGAFDNVSVVIRHTVLQLCTPENMRGRVSAVNGIFIGSSNEIGAFESGITARAFGLKPSIILGGILTILVVVVTARLTPKLRRLNMEDLN